MEDVNGKRTVRANTGGQYFSRLLFRGQLGVAGRGPMGGAGPSELKVRVCVWDPWWWDRGGDLATERERLWWEEGWKSLDIR